MTTSNVQHGERATGGSDVIFRTVDLTKRFGSLVAVDHVNFELPSGEFHSIIGPNGAGKTTMFNLITGVLRPSEGTIQLHGADITDLSTDARARKGIVRSHQITHIFPELTVLENLRLGAQVADQDHNPLHTVSDESRKSAYNMLNRVDLDVLPETIAKTLSHGDKTKLEIGMTLLTDPELLLFDEPLGGLSQHDREQITELLLDVSERHTILLIEHDVDFVLKMSDYITVLHNGAVLAQGKPKQIENDPDVQEAYLGGY